MKKIILCLLFIVSVSLIQNCYAQEFEFLQGLTIGGGITLNLQNLQNSNVTEPVSDDGKELEPNKTPTIGQYSVDLTVEKAFDDNNKAFIHLETGKGNINYYLDSYAGINRDADDTGVVRVSEAWFEHKFTNAFSVTAGILDPTIAVDNNAYANNETTQFIGSMFRNAVNIAFSDNAFGVKAVYETGFADFSVQYIDASDYQDITKYGFASAQVNFKPNFIEDMEGNYRIYGWTNTNDYEKIENDEETEKDYGFGISIDQQLSDIFGAFARYSLNNKNIDAASQTWSLGLQAKINGIGEEDVVAVAYGQVDPSEKYKDYIDENAKSEQHLELYYSWNITNYLAISPDFQMIENPYFNDTADTAYVGSIRMQISF